MIKVWHTYIHACMHVHIHVLGIKFAKYINKIYCICLGLVRQYICIYVCMYVCTYTFNGTIMYSCATTISSGSIIPSIVCMF